LGENKLKGQIPEEIGKLTILDRLYLNSNQITGEFPASIVNLKDTFDIRLQDNNLVGSVPDEVCELKKEVFGNFFFFQVHGNEVDCDCCDYYDRKRSFKITSK